VAVFAFVPFGVLIMIMFGLKFATVLSLSGVTLTGRHSPPVVNPGRCIGWQYSIEDAYCV